MHSAISAEKNDRAIATWLFAVCAMIFLMVVVGGTTRLTESGLSMVTWKPISGVVPPLNQQQWQAEFDAYKLIPQYQELNKGMSLEAFKGIFWWEYSHRLLGRLIGLAFALPFFWFLLRGRIRPELRPKMILMLALGGAQGLLGWYMVKSGLVNRINVSHYRLTAHLSLALVIYSYILWTALGLVLPRDKIFKSSSSDENSLKLRALVLLGVISLQIMLGGFVAGLRAGFIDNTWPLMEGGFLPSGFLSMSPWYMNFLDNMATVQFAHRMVAYTVLIVAVWFFIKAKRVGDRKVRSAAHLVLAAVGCQILLGIMTLVMVVPVALGAAHQAGAVIVLTAAIYAMRRIWPA